MHKQNTRRGYTQVILVGRNIFFTSPLEGEDVQRTDEGVLKRKSLLCTPSPRCWRTRPLPQGARETAHGFTLIELLVVVLIIGILAAVALPQYQVAVKKAQLAKYIPLVKTFTTAEEAYYLANGRYTTDLTALDVEMPAEGCTTTTTEEYSRIDCGTGDKKITYIMVHPYTVESGDQFIRYVYYLGEDPVFSLGNKGDIACFSYGEISRRACKTLGPGEEIEFPSPAWDYAYKLK